MNEIDNDQKRHHNETLIYIIWNVWKERNCRTFEGRRMTYIEVAHLAFKDITQRAMEFRPRINLIPPERLRLRSWDFLPGPVESHPTTNSFSSPHYTRSQSMDPEMPDSDPLPSMSERSLGLERCRLDWGSG